MALKERISVEMKAALLSGNRFVGETLRNLKAAVLNEEVATGKRDEGLADSEIEKVVAREVKKRLEAAKLYRDNNRPELAEIEEKEMAVLETFLPEQLGEAELLQIVDDAIASIHATNPQMMGQVIGIVKQKVGNSADGASIAALVKSRLTS